MSKPNIRHRRRRLACRLQCEFLERRELLTAVSFAIDHLVDEGLGHVLTLATGDLDGDRDIDLVAVTRDAQGSFHNVWYPNVDGAGQFGEPVPVTETSATPGSFVVLDVDGDGDSDLFAIDRRDRVVWHANEDGQGKFSEPMTLVEGNVHAADLGDLDGDGDLDLAVIVENGRYAELWSYENTDGGMTLGPGTMVYCTSHSSDIAISMSDLNNDGHLDIATTIRDLRWHENLGDGKTFVLHETLHPDRRAHFLTSHDMDSDGDLDLIASSNSWLDWFENVDGRGLFDVKHRISGSQGHTGHHLADFDNDGDADFLTADGEYPSMVWHENVSGGLQFTERIRVTKENRSTGTADVADIDGDGDTDIVYKVDGTIYWQENRVIGDSNNDGVYDSRDFVHVFVAGKYENGLADSATYEEGDWNQDGRFDSADFIFAFKAGTYQDEAALQKNLIAAAVDGFFDRDRD